MAGVFYAQSTAAASTGIPVAYTAEGSFLTTARQSVCVTSIPFALRSDATTGTNALIAFLNDISLLETDYNIKNIPLGFLDITFFRDDFRRGEPLEANITQIDFLVEDKKVVFIDDVLFTGRSIRAALTAVQSFGRPAEIELLVLIDRRFSRHLPIQPDYRGRQVDVIANEKVKVCWKEKDGEDAVYLM